MQDFLSAIAREINRRLTNPSLEQAFSRQHLVNYLWALAMVEYNPGEIALRAITEALRSRVENCIAQELGNAVWACAKLRYYDEGFMGAFADEAVRRIDEFTGQNLVSYLVYVFYISLHYTTFVFVFFHRFFLPFSVWFNPNFLLLLFAPFPPFSAGYDCAWLCQISALPR